MEKEVLVNFLNWLITNQKDIIPQQGEVAGVDLGPHLIIDYEPWTVDDFVEWYLKEKG